jgi:hypothetical protein
MKRAKTEDSGPPKKRALNARPFPLRSAPNGTVKLSATPGSLFCNFPLTLTLSAMKNLLAVLFALSVITSFAGCRDDEDPASTLGSTGKISGTVALFESEDLSRLSDASGATVSVEGTTLSTITGSSGQWEIPDLPAGIYNIIISKPGFDTSRLLKHRALGVGHYFFDSVGIFTLPEGKVVVTELSISLRDSTLSYVIWDSVRMALDTVWALDTSANNNQWLIKVAGRVEIDDIARLKNSYVGLHLSASEGVELVTYPIVLDSLGRFSTAINTADGSWGFNLPERGKRLTADVILRRFARYTIDGVKRERWVNGNRSEKFEIKLIP